MMLLCMPIITQASEWRLRLFTLDKSARVPEGGDNIHVLIWNKKQGEIYQKEQIFNPAIKPTLVGQSKFRGSFFDNHFWSYYSLEERKNRIDVNAVAADVNGVNNDEKIVSLKVENALKKAQHRYTMTGDGQLIRLSFNQQRLQLQHLKRNQEEWQSFKLPMPENAQLCDATLDSFNADWSLYKEALVVYTYQQRGKYFIGVTMTSNLGADYQKSYFVDVPNNELKFNSCPDLTSLLYKVKWNNDYKLAIYFNELNLDELKPDLVFDNLAFVADYKPTDEDITKTASNGQSYATLRLMAQAGYESDAGLFRDLAYNLVVDLDSQEGLQEDEMPNHVAIDREILVLLGSQAPKSTLDDVRARFINRIKKR